MKRYDPNEKCPKCSRRMSLREWLPFRQLDVEIGDEDGQLVAKCEACGYAAARAPLDAPADAEGVA